MDTPIVLFFVFFSVGMVFGFATWSRRHLFGEGPTRQDAAAATGTLGDRLGWALMCGALWPILVCTGAYSTWLLGRRRAQLAKHARDRRG